MGKILKYCSKCDEGFAEKFGFCPNCGETLQAFAMNPLVAETAGTPKSVEAEAFPPAPAFIEPAKSPVVETLAVEEDILEIEEPTAVEEVIEEHIVEKAQVAVPTDVFYQAKPLYVDQKPVSLEAEHDKALASGGYYLTVIEEKNVKQRNGLLLGAASLMMFALMSSMVYNIFSKDLDIASINDDIFNAVIVDDVPVTTEEEIQQKKDNDAGGGGGGGREEKEEVTRGDLADQTKNPIRPPDAKVFRSDNFELKMPPPSTEGNKRFEKKYDRWGDPNGRFESFSNGTGSGGGQGSGTGTGQGSGRGTGAGSGTGSGYGSGLGSGNGSGRGEGDRDSVDDIPRTRGESSPLKIISKPKGRYTDAARVANVQGTVVLRVTFLASGQIGSISTVKGLPSGLTESAIAAARGIRFEPAKRDGIPQTTVRTLEIGFAIY
ncbi:MAG: energy transducer TonB [Pyrinomonadaceae bacterium]